MLERVEVGEFHLLLIVLQADALAVHRCHGLPRLDNKFLDNPGEDDQQQQATDHSQPDGGAAVRLFVTPAAVRLLLSFLGGGLLIFVGHTTSTVAANMLGSVRQQGQEAGALHGFGDSALMASAGAGAAPRIDLAGVGDKPAQQIDVLVVDLVDFIRAERADAAALEAPPAPGTAATATLGPVTTLGSITPGRAVHFSFVCH